MTHQQLISAGTGMGILVTEPPLGLPLVDVVSPRDVEGRKENREGVGGGSGRNCGC